jgi:hypothetical protein
MPEMQESCRKSLNRFDSLTMHGQAVFFGKSDRARTKKRQRREGRCLGLPITGMTRKPTPIDGHCLRIFSRELVGVLRRSGYAQLPAPVVFDGREHHSHARIRAAESGPRAKVG